MNRHTIAVSYQVKYHRQFVAYSYGLWVTDRHRKSANRLVMIDTLRGGAWMGLAVLLYPEKEKPSLPVRNVRPKCKLTKLTTVRASRPHIPRPASDDTFEKLFLQMTDLARCRLDQLVCGTSLARLDGISKLSKSVQSPAYGFTCICQGGGMVLTEDDGHDGVRGKGRRYWGI